LTSARSDAKPKELAEALKIGVKACAMRADARAAPARLDRQTLMRRRTVRVR
jgi:hypothetical protein